MLASLCLETHDCIESILICEGTSEGGENESFGMLRPEGVGLGQIYRHEIPLVFQVETRDWRPKKPTAG